MKNYVVIIVAFLTSVSYIYANDLVIKLIVLEFDLSLLQQQQEITVPSPTPTGGPPPPPPPPTAEMLQKAARARAQREQAKNQSPTGWQPSGNPQKPVSVIPKPVTVMPGIALAEIQKIAEERKQRVAQAQQVPGQNMPPNKGQGSQKLQPLQRGEHERPNLVANFEISQNLDKVLQGVSVPLQAALRSWHNIVKNTTYETKKNNAENLINSIGKFVEKNKAKIYQETDKKALTWMLATILNEYPLVITEINKPSALSIYKDAAIGPEDPEGYVFIEKIYRWAIEVVKYYIHDINVGRTYAGLCQDLDYALNYPMKIKQEIESAKSKNTPKARQFVTNIEEFRKDLIKTMKESSWNTIRTSCLVTVVLPTVEDYEDLTGEDFVRSACTRQGTGCYVPFLNDLDTLYQRIKNYNADNFKRLNPLLQAEIKKRFIEGIDALKKYLEDPTICSICFEWDYDGKLAEPEHNGLKSFTTKENKRVYAAYKNEPEKLTFRGGKPDYSKLTKKSKKEYFDEPLQTILAFIKQLNDPDLNERLYFLNNLETNVKKKIGRK